MYHYAGNNPVRYLDPDGQWLDTFMDVAGIVWDVVDIASNPANPWAWGALAADVGCMFIPGATGGGRAIKAAEAASKVSKADRVAGKADDFAAVVIDKATHNKFSKEWNSVLGEIRSVYAAGGDIKSFILQNAERIYKNYPEMLEVTKKWLESF